MTTADRTESDGARGLDRTDSQAPRKSVDGRNSISEGKGPFSGLSRFKSQAKKVQMTSLRSQSTLGEPSLTPR